VSIEINFRHTFGAAKFDIVFDVERPGITVLFGPSGSGKTTTVNVIAGLFKPQQGRIVLGDQLVLDTAKRVFVRPRDRGIGYVFQDARLFPHMSVHDNLRFGWRRSGRRADAAAIARIVELLDLAELLERKPSRLSGGERSRVALGRALLRSPVLLLLDEPLAALDAARRAEILPYLEKLHIEASLPIVYVTHSVDELSRLADEIVILNAGRVARQAPASELLSDLAFSDLTGVSPFGAVIETHVAEQRTGEGLTLLRFEGGELLVPAIQRSVGAVLRVRARAEDVLLARETPSRISANNVLPAIVTAVRLGTDSQADVQVVCGSARLIARITRASLNRLGIAPGLQLFAIVKSVMIDPRMGDLPTHR
jgi:molybdate transport system ATP-binding protein